MSLLEKAKEKLAEQNNIPQDAKLHPPPKPKPKKIDTLPETDLGRLEIDFDEILNAWVNDLDTKRSFIKVFKKVLPTAFGNINTRQTKKGMTQDFNVSATKYLRGTSRDKKALMEELKKGVKLKPKGTYKYKPFILEE